MSTRRFYCENLAIEGQDVALNAEEAGHLSRVLRAEPGDEIELFDGRGRSALARVKEIARSHAMATVSTIQSCAGRSPRPIRARIALPRGGAADDVIRVLIECGVHSIGEVRASRSVYRSDRKSPDSKRKRFMKIALSAMKQSGVNTFPDWLDPVDVSSLELGEGAAGVFGSLAPESVSLHKWWSDAGSVGTSMDFVVGPEGGWTEEEEKVLIERGFTPVSLGPTVLRVQTAATGLATFLAAVQ